MGRRRVDPASSSWLLTSSERRVRENATDEVSGRGKLMWMGDRVVAEMDDLNTQGNEDIGDEPPMTAPPEELGAHYGRPQSMGKHEQLKQSASEGLGRQVVGIAAKRWMSPAGVCGFEHRLAPAAESGDCVVAHTHRREIVLERGGRELWKPSGPREPPYIGHQLDAVCGEQRPELSRCSGGVADGPDGD